MSSELPSFEEAVRLFKRWGFVVEPGPRPNEVTLIIEGPDYRTYAVHEAHMLPQIAGAILLARAGNIKRQLEMLEVADWVIH